MEITRERLEQRIARSSDIVVATDRRGVVRYYNDGASRILGYAQDEVLDTFVGKLYPDLAEAKRVMSALREADGRARADVVNVPHGTGLESGEHSRRDHRHDPAR